MRNIVILSVLTAILLMAGPTFGDLAWDYQWPATILPEGYTDCNVFSYERWYNYVPVRSCVLMIGLYTCQTEGIEPNDFCSHSSKEGLLDAGMPVMAEFRVRFESVAPGYEYTAALQVRDEGRGSVLFNFRPDDPNYYKDEDGFSVFRMVTYTDAGQLVSASLYYLDAAKDWIPDATAELGMPIPLQFDFDSLVFGDMGLVWAGKWYEDYFYWTQDGAVIDEFLTKMQAPQADLDDDGQVNMADFAPFSTQWKDCITPLPANEWQWNYSDGRVGVEGVETILENLTDHVHQPFMERFSDGTIWMSYQIGNCGGPHTQLQSLDNGISWQSPPGTIATSARGLVQIPPEEDLHIVNVGCWSGSSQTHTITTKTWMGGSLSPISTVYSQVTLPWVTGFLGHRSLVRMPDNRLIYIGYGLKAGAIKYSSFCIESTDLGATWSFLSEIAHDENIPGIEGFDEPVMVKLADDSLLCLLRTDPDYQVYQCRSVDGGHSWSKPVPVGQNQRAADPELILLSNGALVATLGTRPGVDLYVDFTGTGDNWKKVPWNGFQGDGYFNSYTAMVEVEPGLIMLITPEGDFCGWDFDGINTIKKAYIRVTPYPSADFSANGCVDIEDLSVMTNQWLTQ